MKEAVKRKDAFGHRDHLKMQYQKPRVIHITNHKKAPEKAWWGRRAERAIRSNKPFFKSEGVARREIRRELDVKLSAEPW